MIANITKNIPVLVVSIIATLTTGAAVVKTAQEIGPLLIGKATSLVEAKTNVPVPTPSEAESNSSDSSNSQASSTTSGNTQSTGTQLNATTTTFTLATLTAHSTSSSCYIAYAGVVYDVTGNPAWSGCFHHGQRGGIDVTSIFPHPTSYLAILPKVGVLTGGTSTSSGTGSTTKSDDSREHENEQEVEHETDD